MRRLLLMSLLLVSANAAAQAPSPPKASKHLRLPPIEGLARRLPKEFDPAPVLRFDGDTDCRAYVSQASAQSAPAKAAPPEERYDGCAVLRRETADDSGLTVGSRYKYLRAI